MPSLHKTLPPIWAEKPAEVYRYWIASESVKVSQQQASLRHTLSTSQQEVLRNIFA